MENVKQHTSDNVSRERRLQDEELARAAGGVGYSSVQCKKCGKLFSDLEQYRKHVEAGCKPAARR